MENLKKAMIIRNGNVVGAVGDKNFSTAPIGTVLAYAGNEAPRGYLLADGASYPTTEYPDLYAVIGNTYGGDSTNFNVPNLVDKFIQGSTTSGTEKEAGLPNITGKTYNMLASSSYEEGALSNPESENTVNIGGSSTTKYRWLHLDASKSNAIYGNSDTVQPPALTMVYIIKAFHTNEGVDSGVSDDVVEYVEGEIAEVETALPNIKKFASPSGTAKYITISGTTLGDIEVHSAYAGKYMFTSTGAKPIFFGTSTYLGYTLTGWTWSSDKTKLYLRVNGQRDFVISAFGSDGVEISDMTTTAPTDVTFNTTFNYSAYIDNSTSENTSTYSSAKIDEKIAEHSLPLVYKTNNYVNNTVKIFKLANVIKDYTKTDFDNLNLLLSTRRGDEIELITGSDDNSNFVQAYRRSNATTKISAMYRDGYDIYVRVELYVNFFRIYHKSGNLSSNFAVSEVNALPDTATEVSIRPLPSIVTTRSLTLKTDYAGYITEIYDPTTKVVVYNVNINGTFKGLGNAIATGFKIPSTATSGADVMVSTIGIYGAVDATTGDAQFTRLLIRSYSNPFLDVDVQGRYEISGTITYVTA